MSDYLKNENGDIKRKGFGIIAKAVMLDKRLSPEAKAIYAYMASFAGAGDTAFPGVERMMEDLNMSKNRFYKHRKQLTDLGYVTITKSRKDGKRDNNIYTLNQIVLEKQCIQNEEVQNEDIEFEEVQNEEVQNEEVQNEPTNNNSLSKTTVLNNNSIKKQHTKKETESKKEIENIVCVLDKKINYSEAKKLFKIANGDIELIKEKYEVAKAIGYKNLMAVMVKAIKEDWQMPKEQEDKPESKSGAVKTKFHNFEQRTSEYTPEQLKEIATNKRKEIMQC